MWGKLQTRAAPADPIWFKLYYSIEFFLRLISPSIKMNQPRGIFSFIYIICLLTLAYLFALYRLLRLSTGIYYLYRLSVELCRYIDCWPDHILQRETSRTGPCRQTQTLFDLDWKQQFRCIFVQFSKFSFAFSHIFVLKHADETGRPPKNLNATQSNPTQPVGWPNPWTTLVGLQSYKLRNTEFVLCTINVRNMSTAPRLEHFEAKKMFHTTQMASLTVHCFTC